MNVGNEYGPITLHASIELPLFFYSIVQHTKSANSLILYQR